MKRTEYTPEIIQQKVRTRIVWKILAFILMEIVGILFMKLYGAAYFARFSETNVIAAYAVLAIAPIPLCGILYDIFDRGWSGTIRKIRSSVVTKWSPDDTERNASIGRNNRYTASVNIRMADGSACDKNLGTILDSDLDRMAEGDTITHFRGTHLFHVVSSDKSHPDHFIGRL